MSNEELSSENVNSSLLSNILDLDEERVPALEHQFRIN